MPAKQLFLLGQQLSVLRPFEKEANRRAHVCGGAGEGMPGHAHTSYLWLKNQRDQVKARAVAPKDWRRVAIVCDAGLGKSTNLQWVQAQIGRSRRQVAFLVELHKSKHLLGDPDLLLQDFVTQIKVKARKEEKHLLDGLKRLRTAGGITLLLDGLDQLLGQDKDALPLQQLQTLLTCDVWKDCSLWIAGRPHIFQSHWANLFADDGWQFVQVEPLDEKTIRFYMVRQAGVDFLSELAPQARTLMATPRYLELLCQDMARRLEHRLGAPPHTIHDTQVLRSAAQEITRDLQTAADLYYEVCFNLESGLLASALRGAEAVDIGAWKYGKPGEGNLKGRINRTAQLLGAIAFSMAEVNAPAAPFATAVRGEAVENVKDRAAAKLVAAGLGTEPSFNYDFEKLIHMNVGAVDYLLFSQAVKEVLQWRDRTMQTFFAAYWVMKHGIPEDHKALQQWIEDEEGKRLEAFEEFWELAIQMPDTAVDPQKWLAVVGQCYAPPPVLNKKRGWIIWSHWVLHHTWQQMQNRAPGKIVEFQSSFQDLQTGSLEQQSIYREINEGFVIIPSGICPFGHDLGQVNAHGVIVGQNAGEATVVPTFQLHRLAVCNAWYEAFDSEHRQERWIVRKDRQAEWRERFSPEQEANCPVVNVDWYDAWAFAHWCDALLPTEEQWEHACRLGGQDPRTAYWWGNTCNGTECNCDGLFPYAAPGKPKPEEGPYLGGLVPVDGLDRHGHRVYSPQHRCRVEQLSGNTWEWTYSTQKNTNRRVLRGGAANRIAGVCRSASSELLRPTDRGGKVGFRLCRLA
jgi:formylglycine-generating enzyme required for sulfatase activity